MIGIDPDLPRGRCRILYTQFNRIVLVEYPAFLIVRKKIPGIIPAAGIGNGNSRCFRGRRLGAYADLRPA